MTVSRTIILATDFSRASESAYRYCLELGTTGHCDIIVSHVYHNARHATLSEAQLKAFRRIEMDDFLKRARQFAGLYPDLVSPQIMAHCNVTTEVEAGTASDKILELSEEHRASAIVIGAKKNPGLLKRLFGQISQVVIYTASRPVIIVPEELKFGLPDSIALLSLEAEDEVKLTTWEEQRVFGKQLKRMQLTMHKGNAAGVVQVDGGFRGTFRKAADVAEILNDLGCEVVALLSSLPDSFRDPERKEVIHALYDRLVCPLVCIPPVVL